MLSTRLFLYRRGTSRFVETSASSAGSPIVFALGMESWQENFRRVESLPHFSKGAWEYIRNWDQIDAIERRFLRNSGKSQDGPVSRYLNRPISRAVTRMLLRFPTTPNGWTWLIFPIPIIAALVLCQGTYGSFVWGMALFQIFSILDGCDGEIARAKFMESEKGRRLDEVFDILSNIFLVLGVGFGLYQATRIAGHSYGWIWAIEGITAALLIGANEFNLISKSAKSVDKDVGALDASLYPRHRNLVERSGMLRLGAGFYALGDATHQARRCPPVFSGSGDHRVAGFDSAPDVCGDGDHLDSGRAFSLGPKPDGNWA